MKRFFVAVISCLMIGLFVTACETVPPEKKGAYTKMGMPRQAQEEVHKDAAPQGKSTADLLVELKSMKDKGLISDSEYEAKRQEILKKMGE